MANVFVRRPTIDFGLFLLGVRPARTTVTDEEHGLLRRFAARATVVVEIGSFEGVTSRALLEVMSPAGVLFMVDHYPLNLRAERLLAVSFPRFVASRMVREFGQRAHFVRMRSLQASLDTLQATPAQLIFIDADHSYAAVVEDFSAWAPRLAAEGVIALHDSRPCAARPDLGKESGPVRLAGELEEGKHGPWRLVASADSVSVFQRGQGGS